MGLGAAIKIERRQLKILDSCLSRIVGVPPAKLLLVFFSDLTVYI